FQAEDGIRDWSVTGVQTCALPISPEFSLICQTNIIRQRRTVVKNCGELRETVIQPLLKPPRTTLNVGLIKRAHPSALLPHEGQLRQFVGWKQVWKARLYAVQGTMPFSGVTTSGGEFHRAPDCPIPRINALKRIEGDIQQLRQCRCVGPAQSMN